MRPLYDKIRQINSDLKARFCMPGHSGEGMSENMYSTACLDWTEVDGLDDLLQSGGVILDSEKLIADSMGCEYALMLTQGSTCGMQIAVASAKERGETLAAVGEMHRSFWSACRLFGMQVICFADARELADAELRDKKIGGVFVTSPDYFGRTKDLGALKKISEEIGALFVVDGAHSAHFCYSSLLPDNSCKIADISLISMHKTLPVYGGGALVCVNGDETYAVCRKYRADIHSTSPNYLTMASMDRADGYMRQKRRTSLRRSEKRRRRIHIGQQDRSGDRARRFFQTYFEDRGKRRVFGYERSGKARSICGGGVRRYAGIHSHAFQRG